MPIQLEVENIKCGGCANSIRKSLLQLPEVTAVEVNVEQGQVTVEAPETSREAIQKSLLSLGYPEKGTVHGLGSATSKAKSFVSCAVGRMSD